MDPVDKLDREFKENTENFTIVRVNLTSFIKWVFNKVTGKGITYGKRG